MPYVMKSLAKVKLEDRWETEQIVQVLLWKNRSNNASALIVLNDTLVLDYLDNTTTQVMAVLIIFFGFQFTPYSLAFQHNKGSRALKGLILSMVNLIACLLYLEW